MGITIKASIRPRQDPHVAITFYRDKDVVQESTGQPYGARRAICSGSGS